MWILLYQEYATLQCHVDVLFGITQKRTGKKYFVHVYRYLFLFQWGNIMSHLHYSVSFYCSKYLPEHRLPENIVATTSAADALAGADFCFHAVPVQVFTFLVQALCVLQGFHPFWLCYFLWQFSSSFLEGISTHVDPKLPFISLSKGLELNTLRTMSKIIPRALGNQCQPFIVLSGPSFAVELMNKLPTGLLILFFILLTCYIFFRPYFDWC